MNEIYTAQKRAAYDSLKEILTEDFITCNEKHVKPYRMPNWIVFVACSNSDEALYLDDEDRRWFVPSLTDKLQPTAYWDALYAWLAADGLGITAGWAKDSVLTDNVRTGDRAPPSMAKAAIVEASRSEGKTLAREVAERLKERVEPTILLARDVRCWIAAKRGMDVAHRHLEKPRTIIAEMVAVEGLYSLTGDKRPRTKLGKEAVVMNFDPADCGTWSMIEGRLATMRELGFHEVF